MPEESKPGHSSLRAELRLRRQSLSMPERKQAALAISEHLSRYRPWQRSQKVALYLATAEEVQTQPLIELAQSSGKEIYLPVINNARWRHAAMLFQHYLPGSTKLTKNKYGIEEPTHLPGTPVPGVTLDLVCVPLVGFNENCDRIGMGAGYYDRAFEQLTWRSTHLLGIAFQCQQAEFEPAAHDVPMHAILTEEGIISRKTTN